MEESVCILIALELQSEETVSFSADKQSVNAIVYDVIGIFSSR